FIPAMEVKEVEILSLKASPFCERTYNTKPPKDLVDSIREHGVIVPIWITKDNKIIAGYRRINACRNLDISKIRAQVVDDSDELSILSNKTRIKTQTELMKEGDAIREIEAEKARIRQKSGKKLEPNEEKGTTA